MTDHMELSKLLCYKHTYEEKSLLNLGTLGGRKHFIELDTDDEGNTCLVVHFGSRRLCKEVTEYYLVKRQKYLKSKGIKNLPI